MSVQGEQKRESEAAQIPESIRRLTCVSVDHRHETDLGEVKPTDDTETQEALLDNPRITEAVVLSTCNRVEVYTSTRTSSPSDRRAAISESRSVLGRSDPAIYRGIEVVEHLSRVSCGLESAVLGEDQILGQVRDRFEDAWDVGHARGVLGRTALNTVRVGKKARDETAINDGKVSYGSAVCHFIHDQLGGPPRYVLVVGGGEMVRKVVGAVEKRWDAEIDVANRSTTDLATTDGREWGLDALDQAFRKADAVVSATASNDPVITQDVVGPPASRNPLPPIVDIAHPPDVTEDITTHPETNVTTLEEVAGYISRNTRDRHDAVEETRELIDEAVQRFVEEEREDRAEDTLRAIHRKAAEIRDGEAEKALNRLQGGEAEDEEIIQEFATALTSKILATPTSKLRDAAREGDEEVIEAAETIFGLRDGLGGDDS